MRINLNHGEKVYVVYNDDGLHAVRAKYIIDPDFWMFRRQLKSRYKSWDVAKRYDNHGPYFEVKDVLVYKKLPKNWRNIARSHFVAEEL